MKKQILPSNQVEQATTSTNVIPKRTKERRFGIILSDQQIKELKLDSTSLLENPNFITSSDQQTNSNLFDYNNSKEHKRIKLMSNEQTKKISQGSSQISDNKFETNF